MSDRFGKSSRSPALLSTFGTNSEQKKFMIFYYKTGEIQLLPLEGTSRKVIDPIAYTTMKMMMVPFGSAFIEHSQNRVTKLSEPPCFQQQFYVAVDGGLIEGLNHIPTMFQNFFNT